MPGDLTTRAIARIYQDLDQGLNPSDLADSLFVSLRTLQRAVSGSLGCSPSELIMAVRLREAYRMLKVEQRSVKDAAFSAGFTSQPHFSRKLKHYFGINPSEVLAGREAPRLRRQDPMERVVATLPEQTKTEPWAYRSAPSIVTRMSGPYRLGRLGP